MAGGLRALTATFASTGWILSTAECLFDKLGGHTCLLSMAEPCVGCFSGTPEKGFNCFSSPRTSLFWKETIETEQALFERILKQGSIRLRTGSNDLDNGAG